MISLLNFIEFCADAADKTIPVLTVHPQTPIHDVLSTKENIPPNSQKPQIIPSQQLYYFKEEVMIKQNGRQQQQQLSGVINDVVNEDDEYNNNTVSWNQSVHRRSFHKISATTIFIPSQHQHQHTHHKDNNKDGNGLTVSIMHFNIMGTPFVVESTVVFCNNKNCRRCSSMVINRKSTDILKPTETPSLQTTEVMTCCSWPTMPLCRVLNTEVTSSYESNYRDNNVLTFLRSHNDSAITTTKVDCNSNNNNNNYNNSISLLSYFLCQSAADVHGTDLNDLMLQTHIPSIPMGSYGSYVSHESLFAHQHHHDVNGEMYSCYCSASGSGMSNYSSQYSTNTSDGLTNSSGSLRTTNNKYRSSITPYDATLHTSFDSCVRVLNFSDPLTGICTEEYMSTLYTPPSTLPGGKVIDAMFCDMFKHYNSPVHYSYRDQEDYQSSYTTPYRLTPHSHCHRLEVDDNCWRQKGQVPHQNTIPPSVPVAFPSTPSGNMSRKAVIESHDGTTSTYKDKPLWFQITLDDMTRRCTVDYTNDIAEGWRKWKIGQLAYMERSVIVNSIDDVCCFLGVSRQTFFASVCLLDQYMAAETPSGPQSPLLDPDSFRIVVVTSVYIASKIHDITPPQITKVIEALGLHVRPDVLCATEVRILTALNFMVHPLTLYDVMHYLNQLPILSLSNIRSVTSLGTPMSQVVNACGHKSTESMPSPDAAFTMNSPTFTEVQQQSVQVYSQENPTSPSIVSHRGHNSTQTPTLHTNGNNYPSTPKTPMGSQHGSAETVRRELRTVCRLLCDIIIRSDCTLHYSPLDLGIAIYNKAANYCGVLPHPRMNVVIGGYRWKALQAVQHGKYGPQGKLYGNIYDTTPNNNNNEYLQTNDDDNNNNINNSINRSDEFPPNSTASDSEHTKDIRAQSIATARIIHNTIQGISHDIQSVLSTLSSQSQSSTLGRRYDVKTIQQLSHYFTRTAREGSFVDGRL